MVLFIGQVARGAREREAFQEIEYRHFFGSISKWVVEIDDAARIPEFVTRAFSVATSGRPGPVVVVLPEDVLTEVSQAPAPQQARPVETAPPESELDTLANLLETARRPFAVLGGTRWTAGAIKEMEAIAEAWGIPVGCSFRRQMLFDHLHPNYAGDVGIGVNPAIADAIRQSDLVLLVGGRFGEMPSSGYSLLESPYPKQPVVHVHADPNEIGRVYRPALAINAAPAAFTRQFARRAPRNAAMRGSDVERLHRAYLEWSTPGNTSPGTVQMGTIMEHLGNVLPRDAIIANGAGNYATWVHRFHRFRAFATQAAPTCGSMGYGVPAAVGAKAAFPSREVVAFAGDGCFMMHGQEFATAIQHDLPIIVIVVNNGMFGTIRMHQEREYPGRVSATDLRNPDFARLAAAYGGHGETVERTEDFPAAFERARTSGRPSLIEIRLNPEAITPAKTLTDIRERR